MTYFLANESDTLALGKQLAMLCPPDQLFVIHLEGELGAGKTTLTRGFLRALGHQGHVKSPTYTLVEHYQLQQRPIYHFDLYRLSDPEELDFLGMDDYFSGNAICLIEWPQQGAGFLPPADLSIRLDYKDNARSAQIEPHTTAAKQLHHKLQI